jgi:hypothetical protein
VTTIDGVALRHRVRSDYGRDRLTEAVYLVALDAVRPCAVELTRQTERDWLNHAMERPIRLAVDAALDTLARELDGALDGHERPIVR